MMNKRLKISILKQNRQIVAKSLLPSALLTLMLSCWATLSYAAPFTTVQTVNTIQGSAPARPPIDGNRVAALIDGKVYTGEFLQLPTNLYVSDIRSVLNPAEAPGEYKDADGDEGSFVITRTLDWYLPMPGMDILLSGIDDRSSIFAQLIPYNTGNPLGPFKLKITTKIYSQSAFGDPSRGGEMYFAKIYFVMFSLGTGPDGSFANPASSCLQIKTNKPAAGDGEYWIKNLAGNDEKVKTFCDMTNGGYTLIWSYSEATALNIYSVYSGKTMSIRYSKFGSINENLPQNLVVTSSGQINYNNYRLPLDTMRNIPRNRADSFGDYRIRIAYNSTDMNDSWGKQNYVNVFYTAAGYDYLWPTKGNGATNRTVDYPAAIGKIFGLGFEYSPTRMAYNNVPFVGRGFYYGGNNSYGAHWDIEYRIKNGKVQGVFPRQNGVVINDTFDTNFINNLFGFHGETEVNHLFGKCVNPTTRAGDDYDFAIEGCGENNKVPHSFNSGQGRYLQWFVK